jgi:tetratricopeptide (TPR) repeat protein
VDVDVRIAVNTGEVLAPLSPTLDPGEGIVGDVVNTAARLQGAAPTNGILAGEATVQLTRDLVDYAVCEPVIVKGKPDPVPVWQVVSTQSLGKSLRPPASDSPFVGRQPELQLLQGIFQRAIGEPGLQLVSVVGEPGIGKSRLVSELEQRLAVDDRGVSMLRGRCLAYGEGIGLWPLGELVKGHLGLAETDSADVARLRLDQAVAGMPDSAWLGARLAPLVGLGGEGGEREEVFTAWQRFFDEVASQQPLVLVLEDLHWAHPTVLAFVQYFAEWSSGVSILVICTARPELFEAHPQWAGGLANATTIALRPLDANDTVVLARSLLGRFVSSSAREAALVERSGGNPLYAEEYARLLAERSEVAAADVPMPDTVQALISARIDTLPLERKELLHDAAVVGKAFWSGAVAALSGREEAAVRAALHELARKELIRRSRTSSIPGDDEYLFWHDLVHQVAYQQIPRGDRIEMHRRTAEWIERTSGARLGDRAELVAHHYQEALSLARITKQGDPEPLRHATVRSLSLAGERALGADVDHAEKLISDGLQLARSDDPERGWMLCLLGECYFHQGRHIQARDLLEDAVVAAREAGDIQTIGAARILGMQVVWIMGDVAASRRYAREAVDELRQEPATVLLPRALGWYGCVYMLAGEMETARPILDEAIAVGVEVGDRLGVALAQIWRGMVDAVSGESDGSPDFLEATRTLLDLGSSIAPQGPHNHADAALAWYGPGAAKVLFNEAIEYAQRIHVRTWEMQATAELPWSLFDLGEWDEVLAVADRVLAWARTSGAVNPGMLVAPQKARVLALRGDVVGAREVLRGVVDSVRGSRQPQDIGPAYSCAAFIEHLDSNPDNARALIADLGPAAISLFTPIAENCRILLADGFVDDACRIIESAPPKVAPRVDHALSSARANVAEIRGERDAGELYGTAAERWRVFGDVYELAHALAGKARTLEAVGSREAATARAEADALFERLGVRRLPHAPRASVR